MCSSPTRHPVASLALGDKALHSLHNGVLVNTKQLQQLSWLPTSWYLANSQASDSDSRLTYYGGRHCFTYAT